MSPITSSGKRKHSNIYHGGYVDCDVMGLPFDQSFEFTENEVTSHIQSLYDMMNKEGIDTQKEVDRYWIALMMIYLKSPLLDTLPWHTFVVRAQDVLMHETLPDIGQYIRMLSTRKDNNDVMCRMIQYSLPYIKHNRLTFAKFEDVNTQILVDLVRILFAMCFGVHCKTCKKPVWQLRFRLFAYMHTLLANGSPYDLYLFCINNVNLIRISIVEYFVYFVQRYMPCEYEMLRHLFGMQTNVESICTQFQLNINHFRSTHMQTDKLVWRDLNDKAHVIIEKCNRICKGKPRMTFRKGKFKDNLALVDESSVNLALTMPVNEHVAFASFHQNNLNLNDLYKVQLVHDIIKIHVLPKNIVQEQCKRLYNALYCDTNIYSRCVNLHQCLRCRTILSSGRLHGQLRTDSMSNVVCCVCSSQDTVVSVNVLGRVVEIFEQKFYFCSFCMGIHRWASSGQEFTCCNNKSKAPEVPLRQCLLCSRAHNLHEMNVLDDRLGVMQNFLLCGRHMPWTHQQHCIYNFETLCKAIQFKMSHTTNI